MAFDFSNISDEELEAMAAQSAPASEPMPQKPLSEWTDEELEAYASEPTPAPAQSAAHSPRMTREERIAANNRAIETARSQEDPGFLSVAGDALAEGAKGAARAVKSIGSGIVGMASGAVRLAGTPVRLATGWEGLHRLADTIDSSYENFGADALMSDYGENPDGFGFAAGRFGEKLAGTAGSLAALGGVGKAVGAAGTALKAAGHAKTAAAVANTLPLMFGNDAAVRAYDTARANGRSKTEAASLAGLNGAIHFLGFKAFENKSLKKMLNIGPEVEVMMPKWADALAEEGGQSFSSLVRGTRNGMVKYIAAENGKRALKAGGIMGLQNFLSDPVMQVAEGASIDDINFSRMLKAGAHGVGEGALMEGALGAAAVLKSPAEARKFIADKYFRGKDYKVMGADGKMHDEPGLLNSPEGRMFLMKQNPDATERVLDIVEHGGTPRPAELDAAFLPPDMTAEELKKFASDWRNDLKPYVDEAWAADAPRQTAAPDAAAAEPGRDMLSPEEAQSQQKAANDAAERQKLADRRAAADSMMLDFESWNRLYADGKTDLNFDEWRAAGKPGVIEANLTPKTEEAPTSETRANEEPAQPEQAEVVAPATGAEARPVEGAEARAEAADARVVESPAKSAEAAQKPAEAAVEPKVGEDTSAPTKPAEAASRASYATPERKAPAAEAEDAPLPSFLAPETAPAEPPKTSVAEPKSAKPKNLYTESKEVSDAYADAAMARYDLSHGVGGVRETNAKLDSAKARLKQLFKDASTEDLLETFNGTVGGRPPTARKGWLDFFGADMANMGTMLMRELESRGYTYNRKTGDMDAPPAEPPAPKSKRLRRADGTDPLVEKEKTTPDATEKTAEPAKTSDEITEARVPQAVQTGEVSSPEAPAPTPEPSPAPAEPTPVKRGKGRPTMTPEQKAKAAAQRAADKVRKIADISRDENGAFRTDMLKASESNPGGLSLKELASLKADKEWHRNLGLPEKDADALRAAVEKAHDDKYLEYHYQSAHDKFADYERGNGDLAFAYNAVSDAASRAKAKGDAVGEQLLQPMLKSLTDKIGALPENEQKKILAKSRREADTLQPKERKNRKSLTTKEGKEVDVATSGEVAEAGEAEEAPDEYGAGSRFNRIEANDDDSSGRSAPKGATGTGGTLGGNRHLIIDGVNGDELTVTMKDAAGKTIATRKMNRAQWSALSQGAVAIDGDPANPQKGDLIRRSRSDATAAPQSWTPEAKKPLERVAHVLRNVVTVGGKKLKVSFADRPAEADGQTRKSIGGIFTGTAADYANRSRQGGIDDGPSLKSIGTGEGAQVYGWGLYGSNQRGVAEEYANRGKYYKLKFDGKDIDQDGGTITAARALYESGMDYDKAVSNLKKQLAAKRHGMSVESVSMSDAIEILENNKGRLSVEPPSKSYVYEQTFFADRAPGDESHLLSWYEPLGAEKAKTIVDGAKSLLMLHHLVDAETAKSGMAEKTVSEWTGKDLYKKMASAFGEEQASRMLRSMGIDGIKYPADSFGKSIKNGDRTGWDYVSFRDDNIRVDHKWTDGELRYMRNADGVTVGEYDAAKGEIRLYPGATVADVVHEFTHPLVDFARAEAKAGRGELLDKINQIIDAERATWELPVRDAYKGKSNETILEEIFTHAMGEKGADLFGKSTKTLQGRRWYNRLWEAIKGVWQDFATKMGWNKADLRGLERMSPEDAAQKILSEMAKGRNFGDVATGGEGTAEARRVVPPKPSAPPPKIDMSKDESLKEKYLRNMSDRYDPLKRLVEEAKESAAKPSDVPDPYHEKRVQSGHNEADRHQIDILKNKYVDFLKRHSHGQKEREKLHEEVNMYLRARDALYRNPEMKKRLGVDDGSGMSDVQAHKILDDFKRRMRTPILDQAFKIMQEVKKTYGLQRLVDGGMLDQATADMLEKRNPDYAPQRTSRLDEEGIDRNSTRNMEAAAIKKALGRSTLSDNPVEFLFLQASDAAARTNENRTRQEMAKFVRMFPEVGKVRTVDKTSAYDLKTGKDAWIEDPHDVESENPLVVSFRENGKRMRIEFADTPRGRLLAESMRNEGVNRGPEAFDRMTRAWASTATQLSATFSGRNFQKDTVEVALNSAADTGFSGAGKFLKAQIAQMKPVVSTIREYLTKGTFGGPLGKELKEFIDAGGSIGGMGREGYEDLKDTFSRKAKGLKMAFSGAHGVKEKVEAILGVTFGKIEDFNKTIEMMSRFNNYRSRRAKGESKKEAVIGSREDSTDFNMYGQQRWLNDVYMFSNSILGGTLRSTKQLATGKNGLKVATAVLAYGFVEAAADVLFNQDDDDEAEKSGLGGAKDLSERERSQTLYFRYGGKYFRIPVHGGPFSALKYTGGLLARAALGKLSWSDVAKNAVKEWATIGTHFGGAGEIDLTNGPKGIVSSFTPSVARPVAELGMNQDFAGRHIYAPEGFDRTTPKSERGFKSTGDGYKWFARLMNKVGGGNESRSADWSWFDNPPEAYKHIVEAVGKNMVRDIMLGGETVGRAVESVAKGENKFTRDDVPFLRDVTRNVPDNSRRYYAALEDYERDKAEFKKTTPERRKEMKADKPYLFTGKSLLDGQIERIKELTHLERGEVKVGQKWVEPKTPRTEEQKEKYRKLRLEMQARVLKRLGE